MLRHDIVALRMKDALKLDDNFSVWASAGCAVTSNYYNSFYRVVWRAQTMLGGWGKDHELRKRCGGPSGP
jgi:hypothetical protein